MNGKYDGSDLKCRINKKRKDPSDEDDYKSKLCSHKLKHSRQLPNSSDHTQSDESQKAFDFSKVNFAQLFEEIQTLRRQMQIGSDAFVKRDILQNVPVLGPITSFMAQIKDELKDLSEKMRILTAEMKGLSKQIENVFSFNDSSQNSSSAIALKDPSVCDFSADMIKREDSQYITERILDHSNMNSTCNFSMEVEEEKNIIPVPTSFGQKESEECISTKEVVKFGMKELSLTEVMSANHGKITVLAGELTALLFSDYELVFSSLKGGRCNAHKQKIPKQKLDEGRVQGVIDYIAHYFQKSKCDVQDEVLKGIGRKLNNFLKTQEAKRILSEYRRKAQDGFP